MKVLANKSFYGIDVLLCASMIDGEIRTVVDTMTVKTLEPNSFDVAPTFRGYQGTAFLQSALQAAWDLGLRPQGFKAEPFVEEARFEAVNNHLQDMRRLVFGRPPVKSMRDIISEMRETTDEH